MGEPLCVDCYDYAAHLPWQWHAPELWRRFTIALTRSLASRAGLSVKAFGERCRVAYTKVVEFQAHGAIHVHAPIRPTARTASRPRRCLTSTRTTSPPP